MKRSNSHWKLPVILGCVLAVLAVTVCLWLNHLNVYTMDVFLKGEGEITVEYGETFEDPGAGAVFSGTVFQRTPLDIPVVVEGTVDLTKVGQYTLCYYAEHEGMSDTETRIVHIVDTAAPVISLRGADIVILPVGMEYTEAGFSAEDNYNGDLTATVTISGTVDSAMPGSYTLTYLVTDESGNQATACRTVVYEDVSAPIITLLGEQEIVMDEGAAYVEPGFSATDDCDGDVTASVTVEGEVNGNAAGCYILVYTVTDSAGHTSTASRSVTVKDMTPPTLTLLGDEVVEMTIGNEYVEPGFAAMDAGDGDLTEQVVVETNLNIYLPGYYTVSYTVSDAEGNAATASRTVIMYEIQPQVPGGIIYLTYDDGPSEYTAQLLDLLDYYGVKATFFVVDAGYGGTMARAANSGHTIAIHSASHNYDKIYASEEAYFNDLYYMQSLIQSYTGQTPMMIRFPGGSSNSLSMFNPGIMTRLTKLVEEKGFRYFDWNVASNDAGGLTHGWPEAAYLVIRGASYRTTSVVLMHDSYATCIRATERIIQWGLANGYTFAPLTYGGPGCHHPVNN